ncbi:hypothetical protein FRC20_000502 [Serendipita sp. 405]|nr:hypothetical protein FRC20_000502 [Serendipita sp. 405]
MATYTDAGYDPSLEFPGSEIEGNSEPLEPGELPARNPLRLVILKSPVLSSKRRIVVLSDLSEVSIGRDVPLRSATSPRLRLKQMIVSKYHAIIYWDIDRKAWGLVDVGSVHGTFIQRDNGSARRLSPPKAASHPEYLQHLDVITVGETHICCHQHEDLTGPESFCSDCSVTPTNELPLTYPASQGPKDLSKEPSTSSVDLLRPQGHRESIASLKRQLLSRHRRVEEDPPGVDYVDRAAARREQLRVLETPIAPPMGEPMSRGAPRHSTSIYARFHNETTSEQREGTETPPQSIPETNIGHKLLAKQGWEPGTGLGLDRSGRSEPVTAKLVNGRAGIGSNQSIDDY